MKVLFGRRQIEIGLEGLAERIRGHSPVHIDVGTGSGRLMLKHASKNPDGFYIGMDPSAQSMHENSLKAAKRRKKLELENLLFVVASIEARLDELAGTADRITVILPWGSLRDGIAKADFLVLSNLRKLGKPGSAFEVIVGYDERSEPVEMQKRSLPALSYEYFSAIAPVYRNVGIEIHGIDVVSSCELKKMESDWAKKLAYGGSRTMYRLNCTYI